MPDDSNPSKALIIIIDDTPLNIEVLSRILKSHGYSVKSAMEGESGIELIKSNQPSLVLLDIMMPGLDGFQVCEKLKAEAETHDIPVIFISALTDMKDKMNAFRSGGVDYISKPFEMEEILARVNAHLTIREQSMHLETLLKERDKFFSIIAHDLKSPISVLMNGFEILQKNIDSFPEKIKPIISNLGETTSSTYNLLENLLNYARNKRGDTIFKPEKFDINRLLHEIVLLYNPIAKSKGIELIQQSQKPFEFKFDIKMIMTIMRNLVSNAIKFSNTGGKIELSLKIGIDNLSITVVDQGIGISDDVMSQILDRKSFYTTQGTHHESGTGLGLNICMEYIDYHKGKLEIQSKIGQGTSFIVHLPLGS